MAYGSFSVQWKERERVGLEISDTQQVLLPLVPR